jgi:transcriptional regulator with XRE-family HTH domain
LNITSSVAEKLRDPEYQKAFVASQINIGLPFQIRALLKTRGKTQDWLAKRTGMLQPRISGLMTPGRTRPNIETLRRIAEAFECGLIVRFAPFSELVKWSEVFDPETFSVPRLDEDTGFIDRKPQASASIFERPAQPPLKGAQEEDNLLIIKPRVPRVPQALTQQPPSVLAGCAGGQR